MMRQMPEKCCRRSRVFSLNRPCPRDTPKLKDRNQVFVPSATPPTHAALAAKESPSTQFARHQVGRQDDPEQQHAEVAEHAHEAGHEGRVRMEFLLDARLDFFRGGAELGRHVDGFGEQKFEADKKDEHEAEHLQERLHDAVVQQRGEPGERKGAVNRLHRRRAEADEQRPDKAALRAFVEDGEVDGAERDRGKNQAADKSRESGQQNGVRFQHG